jgi:hypothetical protein
MKLLALLLSLTAINAGAACIGQPVFQPPVRYGTAADRAILVRDLDGNGAPEILTSGNHIDELAAFSLLLNRGDGTFAAEQLVPSGFGEELEDLGDLDHDGIPDLVVSSYWANGIVVYHGTSALRFDSGTPYLTATHGGPTLILDLDHDGKPDLLSFSFGSGNPVRVHLFPGRGDSTFAAKTTFDTQLANADWPSVRMINGTLDLLVSERSGNLGLLRYTNGMLTVSRLAAGPGFDLSSTFADVNGDGIADVIETEDYDTDAVDGNLEPLFITLGNADGSFRERTRLTQPRTTAFPVRVKVADLDGDGHPDLVVCDYQATSLFAFRGNGAGNFEEGRAISAGAPVNAFDIADVNRDGRADLITANSDHTASVIINGGPCATSRRRVARH